MNGERQCDVHGDAGRPAIFFRDPDMNCLEVVETAAWR
jgi:hypothetical protein